MPIPALLIKKLNRSRCQFFDKIWRNPIANSIKLALLATSNGSACARRPMDSISATVASASERPLLYVRMTSVPRFARGRAALLPNPRLPPVINAMGVVVVFIVFFLVDSVTDVDFRLPDQDFGQV